jgi:hypothetical protein
MQVAIKFECTSSKGCSGGNPPYEWRVYQKVAGCYGIPKVFAKGTQDAFHIMVCCAFAPGMLPSHITS